MLIKRIFNISRELSACVNRVGYCPAEFNSGYVQFKEIFI